MERRFEIGNFIYLLRTEKGLTQRELGDLMGVSDKAVSKWENGASMMRVKNLDKLAEILGVTREEILLGQRLEKELPAAEGRTSPYTPPRERRYFINAYSGIKCIIISEILYMAAMALMGVGAIAVSRDQTGLSVLAYVVTVIIILVSAVFDIAGIVRASKDERAFKTALLFLAAELVLALFSVRFDYPVLICSEIISIAVYICILNGIKYLAVTFSNYGQMMKWDRIVRIAVIASPILNALVQFLPGSSMTLTIVYNAASIMTVLTKEILFLIHLNRAKQQLGEGYLR